MSSVYLVVDSRDRLYQTDTPSSFNISLANQISNVTSVKLKSVAINHKPYNVSAEYQNTTFTYQEGTQTASFDLTEGFYTPEQLRVAMGYALNRTSPSHFMYVVLYSETTSKFTIEGSSNFSIVPSSLARVMGFTQTTSANRVQVSDSIISFDNPDYLLLDIQYFPQAVTTSNNMYGSFIINSDAEQFEYKGLINQCQTFGSPMNIKTFIVYLKNRDGSEVNMRGAEWYAILELYIGKS